MLSGAVPTKSGHHDRSHQWDHGRRAVDPFRIVVAGLLPAAPFSRRSQEVNARGRATIGFMDSTVTTMTRSGRCRAARQLHFARLTRSLIECLAQRGEALLLLGPVAPPSHGAVDDEIMAVDER